MTEDEWLSCTDPTPMLAFLQAGGRASDRKLRLFPISCVRSGLFRFGRGLDIGLDVLERYADGEADGPDIDLVFRSFGPSYSIWAFMQAFTSRPYSFAASEGRLPSQRPAQAALLRDLFGNPFRPPALDPEWLTWNGGTVPKLAGAIYERRAYDRMPILADALEEAGCTDANVLDHLRGPGPHARGCWALDAVLGKA